LKPSERLQVLTDELVADVRARAPASNFAKYEAHYRERARWGAIAKYLDDQHELDRRRIALWTALALIGPGCQESNVNPLLEAAGVAPCARNGDPFEMCRERILDAAREAGLL
jgi:hypothetical protein